MSIDAAPPAGTSVEPLASCGFPSNVVRTSERGASVWTLIVSGWLVPYHCLVGSRTENIASMNGMTFIGDLHNGNRNKKLISLLPASTILLGGRKLKWSKG